MNKKIIEIVSSDAKTILKENKSFCAAPWIHTHIWPDGRVFPCCMSDYRAVFDNVNEKGSFLDIWNGETYKNFRKDMIEGTVREDVCNRCYEQETHSIRSYREKLTTEYWNDLKNQLIETKDDFSADLNLPFWDYRFNNICNLSCRTCGPDLSSSWYQDHIKLFGLLPKHSPEKFVVFDPQKEGSMHKELIEDQIKNVKEIYFAGGEPVLMPEHLDIINRLIDTGRTDVLIRYSTNLSVLSYKGFNFLDVWPKFKEVLIMISLDDIGERAEYWRNGTDWNRLEKNIKTVMELSKKYPNVKVGYAPTISIFNVHRLDIYMEYLLKNNLINIYTPFAYNILQGPMEYNIKTLPKKYKDRAKESIDRLEILIKHWDKHQPGIQSMRSYLDEQVSNEEEYQTLAAYRFARIDKVRNQSLKNVAPDIYEIYENFGYEQDYESFTIKFLNEKENK